jgi:hypothetical protein
MPLAINIPEYLEFGEIAQFLAADDNANFVRYPGGTLTPNLPQLLKFVRSRIEYAYSVDPTDESLTDAGTYLRTLIGKYWAQGLMVTGGGTGIVINPGTSANYSWIRVQTTVGTAGALPLGQGDTVYELEYSGVIYGSVEVVVNQVTLPRNDSNTLSYVLTVSADSFTITFNQGVNENDIIVVNAVQLI